MSLDGQYFPVDHVVAVSQYSLFYDAKRAVLLYFSCTPSTSDSITQKPNEVIVSIYATHEKVDLVFYFFQLSVVLLVDLCPQGLRRSTTTEATKRTPSAETSTIKAVSSWP